MRVYVGNVPFGMGDDDLRVMFEDHGSVNAANIIVDRETGRSRGFGFVEMTDETEARKAIEVMANFETGGRTLVVNEARPRNTDGRGGGMRPHRDNWSRRED